MSPSCAEIVQTIGRIRPLPRRPKDRTEPAETHDC